MNKKTILIADSCAGGLDVLRYFLDWAGEYELCYIADGKEKPFGLKTEEEIKKIVIKWIEGLQNISKEVVLVVIACNTASIATLKSIKSIEKKYGIPIITMVDGIKRLFKKNRAKINNKKVLVMGTKYSIDSGEYQKRLNKMKPKELQELSATKTERFIARGLENNKNFREEMRKELSKYKSKRIETIVLGCTCFEFSKEEIRRIYGKEIFFLNPAKEVSEASRKILKTKNKKTNLHKVKVYTTGDLELWSKNINIVSKKVFGKKLKVRKINLISPFQSVSR